MDCTWLKIGDTRKVYPALYFVDFKVTLGMIDRQYYFNLYSQDVFSGTGGQSAPLCDAWRDGEYFKQLIAVLIHNESNNQRQDFIHRIFIYEISW